MYACCPAFRGDGSRERRQGDEALAVCELVAGEYGVQCLPVISVYPEVARSARTEVGTPNTAKNYGTCYAVGRCFSGGSV